MPEKKIEELRARANRRLNRLIDLSVKPTPHINLGGKLMGKIGIRAWALALACAVAPQAWADEATAPAAPRAKLSAHVVSPIRGLFRLDVDGGAARVEMHKTMNGRDYVWAVTDGRTGPLLQGPEGADCPRSRQFVHLTSNRLVYGWNDLHGRPVGRRWLPRACFEGGKVCRLGVWRV